MISAPKRHTTLKLIGPVLSVRGTVGVVEELDDECRAVSASGPAGTPALPKAGESVAL